jgi:hypothetical protein
MSRYVILKANRTRADYLDDDPVLTAQTVHVPEDETVDTGLLDVAGNKIGRVIREPIGFDLTKAR